MYARLERTVKRMSDLISRQAAIEALFDWEMTYDWDDHCREEDPKPAYIVSPSDVIEQLPSAQQWIPVTERLPEEEKAVLVTTDWGFLYIAEYEMFSDGEGRWSETVEGRFIDAMAWMPLPEPWKGEEDDT